MGELLRAPNVFGTSHPDASEGAVRRPGRVLAGFPADGAFSDREEAVRKAVEKLRIRQDLSAQELSFRVAYFVDHLARAPELYVPFDAANFRKAEWGWRSSRWQEFQGLLAELAGKIEQLPPVAITAIDLARKEAQLQLK